MTTSDTKAVLDSVISTGQAFRRTVGPAEIERFIAAQPDVTGPVTIRDVRGNAKVGASSGIVIFTADYDGAAGRQTRDMVLRHAPGSDTRLWYDYDMARQFRIQKALQGSGVPVPDPLWLDADGAYLGLPGYVMVAVAGEAPNPSAFVQGPLAEASPPDRESMLDQVMAALVGIHTLDVEAAGIADLTMNADGDNAMAKSIEWYWKTWQWIDLPEFERLAPVRRWLLDNAQGGGETLTHGDSTLHNYLFMGNRLTGVLDWEMSAIARPECDLALQLVGNELFAAPPASGMAQPPSEAEWLERYDRAGGRPLSDIDYYKRFSAYMIVIAICALQRNMPAEVRAAQQAFAERLWRVAEGD